MAAETTKAEAPGRFNTDTMGGVQGAGAKAGIAVHEQIPLLPEKQSKERDPSCKFEVLANIVVLIVLGGFGAAVYFTVIDVMDNGFGDSIAILIFAGFGAFLFLKKMLTFFRGAYQYVIHGIDKPAPNLVEQYGRKSWGLVCGGTGGIGKAFVHYLARQNINVAFTGRKDSGYAQAAQLQKQYPGVEIEFIKFDLTKVIEPETLEEFMTNFDNKDVSLLIHAAGISNYYLPFHNQPPEKLYQECLINMMPSVILTQQFAPKLLDRTNGMHDVRSGILFVGAGAANVIVPAGVYGATKAFLDRFARYIAMCYRDEKLDVHISNPMGIYTDMVDNLTDKADGMEYITPKQYVKVAMKQFGTYSESSGWCTHAVQTHMAINYLNSVIYRVFEGKLKKILADEAAEQHV